MSDPLMDMYGIPEDADPLKKAAVRRAGKAADAIRARSHSSGPQPGRADSLARQGSVLANAMADDAARAAEEQAMVPDAGMAPPPGPDQQLASLPGAQAQEALDIAGVMQGGYAPGTRYNPLHGATKQYIDESRELAAERPDIVEQQYRTQAEIARDSAVLADEAHQANARMELRQQFMAEQQARKRAEVDESVAKYTQAVDKASAEFEKADKFDPASAWADKSAGQKIRISLAAIGAGLRGGKPSDVFNDVLQRELAAHRQMRSDKAETLKSARADMGNALTMRDTFLALSQDERVADAMIEATTLRKIKSKMDAMVAQYGERVLTDQFVEAQNTAEQMLVETDYKLNQLEAANWRKKTVMRDTLGRETRKTLGMLRDQAVKGAGEAMKQEAGMYRDAAKADVEGRQRAEAQGKKERFDQKKWLAQQTGDLRTELDLINSFEEKYQDDIPGIHALSRGTPDIITRQFQDNRDARKELERIISLRLRRESGAAISDEEIAREAEATVDAMTEDDVRNDLGRRRAEAQARMDYLTRATSTDLEAEYLNRPVGPRSALARGGGGGQGPASLVLDE